MDFKNDKPEPVLMFFVIAKAIETLASNACLKESDQKQQGVEIKIALEKWGLTLPLIKRFTKEQTSNDSNYWSKLIKNNPPADIKDIKDNIKENNERWSVYMYYLTHILVYMPFGPFGRAHADACKQLNQINNSNSNIKVCNSEKAMELMKRNGIIIKEDEEEMKLVVDELKKLGNDVTKIIPLQQSKSSTTSTSPPNSKDNKDIRDKRNLLEKINSGLDLAGEIIFCIGYFSNFKDPIINNLIEKLKNLIIKYGNQLDPHAIIVLWISLSLWKNSYNNQNVNDILSNNNNKEKISNNNKKETVTEESSKSSSNKKNSDDLLKSSPLSFFIVRNFGILQVIICFIFIIILFTLVSLCFRDHDDSKSAIDVIDVIDVTEGKESPIKDNKNKFVENPTAKNGSSKKKFVSKDDKNYGSIWKTL